MTTIYLLADECLPDVSELEKHLKASTAKRYVIERVPGVDALRDYLAGSMQAVVFSGTPADHMTVLTQQCRAVLPATAFVSVIDSQDTDNAPILETDCHFLRRPYDSFMVLNELSSAIRQCELLATLSGSAQLDEVTNLYSRRYFMQRLGEEISLSKRHLSPLCCVIIGISLYQMYLDSYGYDFMHGLFRFVADKIGSSIRHEDLAAHISDDEIAILLPRSTEKGARVFTNRLILDLNASVFRYGGYEEELSVCAGLIGYPLPENLPADADTLIRYGRHALHQARCSEDEHVRIRLFSEIRPAF